MGLGSLALLSTARLAAAAPATPATLAGVLDGSGAMHQQAWQTAYLMAEGSAEARVVGPLNRGARLEIDPARSSDQYWFVHVPDSPGNSWQGYVWKDFVRVTTPGGAPALGAAATASPSKMTPMAESLAQHDPATAGPRAEAADRDEPVEPAKPRVELEHAGPPTPKDSSMVAYDPELFEVRDAAGVRAVSDAPGARAVTDAPPRPQLVPPSPAPAAETDAAGPVRQIQALREQIERELEAAPQTALTPGAAQNVDQLVNRLNDVLKLERSMAVYLESTSKLVETHDEEIHDLQVKLTTMTAKGGPERTALSDEIKRLRAKVDDLSANAASVRAQARRIDAIEAKLRHESPVALQAPAPHIAPDHGGIVVSPSPAKPHRKSRGEKMLEEGVIEVTGPEEADDASAEPAPTAPPALPKPRADAEMIERGTGLRDGSVGAMLEKLHQLREQKHAERVAKEKAQGAAPAEKADLSSAALEQKAASEPPEKPGKSAAIIDGAEPVPDDMREDESPAKPHRDRANAQRLGSIEHLLTAHL